MKLPGYMNDMSLRKKIIILFAIVGIAPLIVTFFVSYSEIRKLAVDGQSYAEKQNFEQMQMSLSKKFYHLEELTSMVAFNKDLQTILSKDPAEMSVLEQLTVFNKLGAYSQIMENNSDFDRIIYFIDDKFKFALTGHDTMFRRLSDAREAPWAVSVYANKGRSAWGERRAGQRSESVPGAWHTAPESGESERACRHYNGEYRYESNSAKLYGNPIRSNWSILLLRRENWLQRPGKKITMRCTCPSRSTAAARSRR